MIEIDRLKILILLQAETIEHVTRQDRQAGTPGTERDRMADEIANGSVGAVGAHHEHARVRSIAVRIFNAVRGRPIPMKAS